MIIPLKYAKIRQKYKKGTKLIDMSKSIILTDLDSFDIRHILDCGQIFRYTLLSENKYMVFTKDKRCIVEQSQNQAVISFDNEQDRDYFWHYFDLDTDYNAIKTKLADKPMMREAIAYGNGIRILNQDKWETLISFIISANNHIPRIKGIIDRLCTNLGQNMGDYYAFPTPQAMAGMDEDFYKSIGAGYRAKYLSVTSRAIAEGFDLDVLDTMNGLQANKRLCSLMGIGEKVADCILLFAYHKQDIFPVDTWIKKVYYDLTGIKDQSPKIIRKYLIDTYGEDLAGYAQQYLFFNKREN